MKHITALLLKFGIELPNEIYDYVSLLTRKTAKKKDDSKPQAERLS